MPSYEYDCAQCGVFSANRPIAEWDRPAPCPACGADAPRTLTAPAFGGGSRFSADAASTPAVSHPGGCACCRPSAFTRPRLAAQ